MSAYARCDACGHTLLTVNLYCPVAAHRELDAAKNARHDNVNHPKHYTSHASGVECITVVEHMSFNLGNAMKYLWRADEKGAPIEDLKKARWYLDREIARREKK